MANKITRATIKSFIKNNVGNLYIKTHSDFNGMTDCVERVESEFRKAIGEYDPQKENTLGVDGVWLVGQSRDTFVEFNSKDFKGYTVANSCGSWTIAIKNTVNTNEKKNNETPKSNLTELQQKFIKSLTQELTNKKDLLKFLNENNIMNGMQAGACITTLRKKGLIEIVGKDIKLI